MSAGHLRAQWPVSPSTCRGVSCSRLHLVRPPRLGPAPHADPFQGVLEGFHVGPLTVLDVLDFDSCAIAAERPAADQERAVYLLVPPAMPRRGVLHKCAAIIASALLRAAYRLGMGI